MSCAVVIPIYKKFTNLEINERDSLFQCCKVLFKHKFVLVCSEKFIDVNSYTDFFFNCNKKVKIQKFKDSYFQNIQGYSRLLVKKEFYKKFIDYDHILIYQTDAYVFRDELDSWCKEDYDYIGAPWFNSKINPVESKFYGVGNGGFSLRKVKKFITILNRLKSIEIIRSIFFKIGLNKIINYKTIILRTNFIYKIERFWNLDLLFSNDYIPEDQYFGIYVNNIFSDFTVPRPEIAMRFSFETRPNCLFEYTNEKLPFGCHGWNKYEPQFWKKYINMDKDLK